MSPATPTRTRRRVAVSPLALGLGGLAAAALLAAALALLGPGTERGAAAGGAGQLTWATPPRVYAPPGMPRDRILSGVVRNDSVRVAEVEADEIRVYTADGDRLKSAGIFLGAFSRGLYSGPRKGQASDIEERRTGRLLRVGPGAEQPLTVSWRTGPAGRAGTRIEYGSGSLAVP
ncbi:MAG: hypothetical protein AVDCRST_MAG45-846 [uncultured Solirubrobacterales bacterium]|uniref:Uncharacterized protein n=1 Tax=uncultured Solirubrobacterales bacterium TaxID=768556 RepID=A0A6J4SI73_9ACTN|nr:MAG: hypothetical protein AVDCRST_MAG45-846 [uncultured Solirubrobacterales bacterium]